MNNRSSLQKDNSENIIVTDSVSRLKGAGFADSYIWHFTGSLVGILNDYAELIGEKTEVQYRLIKKFTKIELRIQIPGAQFDPFTSGSEAQKRMIEALTHINLNTELPDVSYKYQSGANVIFISVPLDRKKKKLYKDPMFLAVVFGVVVGLICLHLPESANSFIIDNVVSPLRSKILGAVSGIMGPVIFISITTSIVAMGSIDDLTHLGFRIVRRFAVIILFVIVLSMAVSALFINFIGTESLNIAAEQIVNIVLNIIPTNPITPFTENNTAQIVVLGFLMGSALLLLGEKVSELKKIITQVHQWIFRAMKIILKAIPVVPFLSLVSAIGSGNFSTLLNGWKFIAASYIVSTLCVVIKAVKTSAVTGVRIPDFLKRIKPVIRIAFSTGSDSAPVQAACEVSSEELNIKPEFSSLWVSMNSAMMSLKTTITLITSAMLAAEMCGVSITPSFILILVIVTFELSMASPGVINAMTTLFGILGISTDLVGIFIIYRVFTINYMTACTMTYNMFEELEAAHKLGGMKEEALNSTDER